MKAIFGKLFEVYAEIDDNETVILAELFDKDRAEAALDAVRYGYERLIRDDIERNGSQTIKQYKFGMNVRLIRDNVKWDKFFELMHP